ncbi:sulfurtransferase [Bacillus sp. BRMEA1]|uniref:sulfurtransferase n=1 Tax=Neobacillus endophyticus TaxID=2738405 RepID=UPI0015647626|nr:sulfurtransferase [Neobacillus endophyticus]NRD80513.1 sulfurtransferase [Neobacillus endophyticus]
MKFAVDKEWLYEHLLTEEVRIIDCRFSLAAPEKGYQEYLLGHLPGAVYFDLEKDLSSPVGKHGGRHPLPDLGDLQHKLENAGIGETTVVVAYDGGEGSYAARFWWLLHYLGHEKVFVLNGGFNEWVNANFPITKDIPFLPKQTFQTKVRSEIIADISEVKEAAEGKTDQVILIDSREEKRYLGIEEPIDKKAGHIPGAINKPWMDGLRNGRYKTVEEQKNRFMDLVPEKQIIVYCGSGVTAIPNFLSLKDAGYDKVKLYIGSFSDWISYEENKIKP